MKKNSLCLKITCPLLYSFVIRKQHDSVCVMDPSLFCFFTSKRLLITAVLKYHVVLGTHYSAGLSSGNVNTLEGRAVNITVSSGRKT